MAKKGYRQIRAAVVLMISVPLWLPLLFISKGGNAYAKFGCVQTQARKLVKGFEYRKEMSDEAI
ncbi:hypothetical protein ES707_15285 [subsurface metagenome]|jgi:hypothetical protein